MDDDHKAKGLFCIKHYDQSDADFHELVKRTNWLKDPLVRELFRRLDAKQAAQEVQLIKEKIEALTASKIAEAAKFAYQDQRQRELHENQKTFAKELAVEAAIHPWKVRRKGRHGEYLPFVMDLIRTYGGQTKGALVAACLVEWPDRNRSAFSNTINRELERKNGKLGEDLNGLIVLKTP